MTLRAWFHRRMAEWHYSIACFHRYLGNTYGLRPEHAAAVDQFTRALHAYPEYAPAYLARGILYWRELDHPRRAIIDLTTAYELDPTLDEACLNRGVAHQILREYPQAIADFEAYLETGADPQRREYAQKMIKELREWVPAMD